MSEKRFKLTTTDNPFNPFDDFESWQAFDHAKGYYTNELIARLAACSPTLSDDANDKEWEEAMETVLKHNLSGVHVKVYEPD